MNDPQRPAGPALPPEPTNPMTPSALLGLPPTPPAVVKRNAKGQLLPGQKLNPTGRRTSLPALMQRVVDQYGGFEKATEVLCEIAWGRLASGARLADRMRAIEILYDRVHGKSREHVTIDEPKSGASLQGRSLDELREMRAQLRALKDGNDVQEAEIVDDED